MCWFLGFILAHQRANLPWCHFYTTGDWCHLNWGGWARGNGWSEISGTLSNASSTWWCRSVGSGPDIIMSRSQPASCSLHTSDDEKGSGYRYEAIHVSHFTFSTSFDVREISPCPDSMLVQIGEGIYSVYTIEIGSLHTPWPNTFKLSFSQFLTFNPSKTSLS